MFKMTVKRVFVKMNSFMPAYKPMKLIALPDYNDLNHILHKTTLKLHPSQVHGLSCGMLCGQQPNESVFEELVTGAVADAKEAKKAHDLLKSLYEISKKQLEDFLFDFELLLPDDSESLTLRAEALTLWSQGFLTGLKMVDIAIVNLDASEMSEAINDLVEIAKMNYEDVVDSEEDEAAYIELVEFVRMAVILIYQDVKNREMKANNAVDSHLH